MQSNVLIVDDNSDIRKLLGLTLASCHYQLHEAANGQQALSMVQKIRPQLVLLDVMKPSAIDGYEVCRQLKADTNLSSIRVILITARGQQKDFAKGLEVGADLFLVKPFSPSVLVDEVQQLLAEISILHKGERHDFKFFD
jgi:two-component system phosphate regulon response regulator PhoB